MKKHSSKGQKDSPAPGSPASLRPLQKYRRELQALLVEANAILRDLILEPSAEVVRCLCRRFRILQEYFALRYRDARAHAIAALGLVEGALFFPCFEALAQKSIPAHD